MKENNSLMGWEPPRDCGNNDSEPKDKQPRPNNGSSNDDPWGRNRKSDDDGLGGLFKKAEKVFSGGGSSGKSKFGNMKPQHGLRGLLLGLLVVLAGIYIFMGFYTVKEAERGVVLRFGKFYEVVNPGLQWRFAGIDQVSMVDIEQVRSIQSAGAMLTEDENVVIVEMDVQYRISNPFEYLYSVTSPDNSLMEATDSALRYVIGHTLMDDILTSGREQVRQNTRELLISIIEPYKMGLTIVDVNFLPARAPDEVKAAFDDAIAAQEDEQRFKREAEAYANEVLPRAEGQVQRIHQEAEAYRSQVVLDAQGEVARFEQILPEYTAAPEITRKRIYLETMQEVMSNSSKIILDTPEGSSPVLYLPMPATSAAPASAPTQVNTAPSSTYQAPVSSTTSSNIGRPSSVTNTTQPLRPSPDRERNAYGNNTQGRR